MALYRYTAFSKTGQRRSGTIDAESRQAARNELTRQGLYPVDLAEQATAQASRWNLTDLFQRSVQLSDKLFFTKQLSVLLEAGVPLLEALNLIIEQTSGSLRSILIQIRDDVTQGKSLADSLDQFPTTFESIYVQLVRAGEAGGNLEVMLQRLYEYLERQEELRKKVSGALTYPIVQIGVILVIAIVLVAFVLPRIAGVFQGMDVELPGVTKAMLGLSDFITTYYLPLLIMCAVMILSFVAWVSTPSGARTFDAIKLRMPIVGYFEQRGTVVQFSRTLGLLLDGGVTLSQALDIVVKIVDNRVLTSVLEEARDKIIKQGKVAEYLRKTEIFPPIAMHLISTGEESGQLDNMLLMVGNQYERELREYADSLTAKITPIMTIIIAILVGFIVLSVMMPMLQLTQKMMM